MVTQEPRTLRLTLPQALERAVNFHRQGQLADAEAIYGELIKVAPDHFDALHMLAVVRYQQGRHPDALPLIERALQLQPESPDALSNYGLVLRALSRRAEAIEAFDRALRLRPNYPAALSNRGNVLVDLDRAAEALEIFDRTLILHPGFPDALLGRGIALSRLERFTDALIAFDRVLAIEANHVEALTQRAGPLRALRRHDDALATCEQAIAVNGGHAMAHYNRGVILVDLGRIVEAAESYQRAIALQPNYIEALSNLATALERLKRLHEALTAVERALALDPTHLRAWNNRGNILLKLGRHAAAMESYDRAIAIDVEFGEAHYNKGNALLELERVDEALRCFQAAVRLRSDHPDFSFNEGVALLLLGDLRAGLQRYEGRFHKTEQPPLVRSFRQPRWSGGDISGKRILLHAEQGLGDTVHFARYVPLVARRGAEVILEVQAPLKSLLAGLEGVSRIYAYGEDLPAFDLHQHLPSLGAVFETDLDSIPAGIPYIAPPSERVAQWSERLPPKQGLRVGLVWAGNPVFSGDATRSIGLARLAPILAVPGVQFFSLHRELRAEDAAVLQAHPHVVHVGAELTDLADTAALVSQLDLVIGSDTAVIHLAGALGKPVWLLTKRSPDWRWLLDRQDSPWYPTARLYRQPAIGDWATVVERVRRDLVELAQSHVA
jgi:tetratricopeptide (TPR) repeat protein